VNSVPIEEHASSLRYLDRPGEGPPIVFLHGLGSASSFAFPAIAADPHLRSRRAILVDFLGFGYSDRPTTFAYSMDRHAETVVRLLDQLGLVAADLFGHSMGGAVAVLIAHARPARVARLVSAEGNLDPEPGIVSGIITQWSEAEYAASGHAEFLRGLRAQGFADYARTVEAAEPIAVHRSAVDLIADRDPTFRELLLRLPIPRTYLFSEESAGDPNTERLPRVGVSIGIVPAAGHDMMSDNPCGLAEAIANALPT